MIDKKNIIKMADHVFHRSQGYPDRKLMHPEREWMIGLLVFIIISLLGGLVARNLFLTYRNTDVVTEGSVETVPKYKEVITQDALEQYRVRDSEYLRLRNEELPVVVSEVHIESDESDASEVLPVEKQDIGSIEESF